MNKLTFATQEAAVEYLTKAGYGKFLGAYIRGRSAPVFIRQAPDGTWYLHTNNCRG